MSPMRFLTRRRGLQGLAIVSVLSGIVLWRTQLTTGSAVAVERPLPIVNLIAAPGLIEPVSEEIAMSNLVQGTIRRVPVAAGDHVAAGQILVQLDNDDLTAAVSAAKAQVDLEQSGRTKLINGARFEERQEAAANLRDAEALTSMAALTLQRRVALAMTHAVTTESVDQARTDLRSATARRDSLADRLALINAPPRREDVAMADANVALAEAKLKEAQAMLEKSYIRAPIDGTVLRILRRPGEQVSATFPSIIIVMGDTSRLRVRAEIDETDIGRIRVGQHAYATVDAYAGRRFPGTISYIAKRMGKKAVHTDDPSEKIDAKVLDVLVTLEPDTDLPVGLRVDAFVVTDAVHEPATTSLQLSAGAR